MFRKAYGGAWLRSHDPRDPRLVEWERQGGTNDRALELALSDLLRERISYAVIPVEDKDERAELEAALIGLPARYGPAHSQNWLGLFARAPEIKESGLWNTQHVSAPPLSARQFARLDALAHSAPIAPLREESSHVGSGVLVVIPCGKRKVWDARPDQGPTPAGEAYGGPPFIVNRQYAEHFGERWAILSAKYGFVRPDTLIENYKCTFKNPSPELVDDITLAAQVRDLELCRFREVVVLGGVAYLERARRAFGQCAGVSLHFPFAGLRQGEMMGATKQAVAADVMLP